MLNYAVAHGYLERNPFQGAAGLIQRSKENKRERVLKLTGSRKTPFSFVPLSVPQSNPLRAFWPGAIKRAFDHHHHHAVAQWAAVSIFLPSPFPSERKGVMSEQSPEQRKNVEINDDLVNVRVILGEMLSALNASPKRSRERSIVITKLEEAGMWAQAGLARE